MIVFTIQYIRSIQELQSSNVKQLSDYMIWPVCLKSKIDIGLVYRVTIQVVPNLPLTSKQKFCFSRVSTVRLTGQIFGPGKNPPELVNDRL